MSTREKNQESALAESDLELQPPSKYIVFLLNDDYTTMEFVVEVLKRFFGKSEEHAFQVMLLVHNEGRGVAGIYPLEIAETKISQVEKLARSRGFPLRCEMEREGT